jgi:hypothetical protein
MKITLFPNDEYNIKITNHAIQQYQNRIATQEMPLEVIKQLINRIFRESKYVSDNQNGILFRHEGVMIEFIVKEKKIITLYPITKKIKGEDNDNSKNVS